MASAGVTRAVFPNADAPVRLAGDWFGRFERKGPVVVAVSGGSDSTAALVALHRALPPAGGRPGFSLLACTVDHGLRAESAEEAAAVGRLCRTLGIVHVIRRWDGAKPASGLQAAAREARYRLLADVAKSAGAVAIVTGHTREDQAETIAMRAARMPGQAVGLAGMAEAVLLHRRFWLLRPFLACRREELRFFLRHEGIGWFDDPANRNIGYERVRWRARAVDEGIVAGTATQQALRRGMAAEAAERIARHVRVHENLVAEVAPPLVAEMAAGPAARRAVFTLSAVLGGRRHPPSSDTMTRLLAVLSSGEPGRVTAGRTVFDRRRDALYLYREARDLPGQPDGEGLWDGRFRLPASPGGESLRPACDPAPFAGRLVASGVPQGVARRAAVAAPEVVCASGEAVSLLRQLAPATPSAAMIEPVIAPYDTFLPCFDLTMADEIARLFRLPPYPRSPLGGENVL
ncbi:tRNA lysidine(34) synthetase TilS [Ensifer soli]|uniref:tRNA lysidine(34) synthetase TilS n=1 Tax=Ciceribacter sp. sgz301302 TaxID=3342379 RepID=UPI0035BA19A6